MSAGCHHKEGREWDLPYPRPPVLHVPSHRQAERSCRANPCEGSIAPTIRPALPVASQPAIDRLWPAGSIRREGATRHPRTTHALGWLLGRSGGLASSRPAGGGNRVQWPFLRSSACGTLKIWHQKLQRATSNGGGIGVLFHCMRDTDHQRRVCCSVGIALSPCHTVRWSSAREALMR